MALECLYIYRFEPHPYHGVVRMNPYGKSVLVGVGGCMAGLFVATYVFPGNTLTKGFIAAVTCIVVSCAIYAALQLVPDR